MCLITYVPKPVTLKPHNTKTIQLRQIVITIILCVSASQRDVPRTNVRSITGFIYTQ
jgi:hypothetical protein